MIRLARAPSLVSPTTAVRTSYLVGEQADMIHRGADTAWLDAASRDFDAFVRERTGIRERWGVPSEVLWYTSGEFYLGSLVIRHQLTDDEGGGHIGYHVVYPWQRRGHATRMLREALVRCAGLGLDRVLLTVAEDNAASLAVVRRCGGVEDGIIHEDELRFWIDTRRATTGTTP